MSMRETASAPTFDAPTTLVLRAAYHKIDLMYRSDRFALYDYARAVMSKLGTVDTFYVGLIHGTDRVRYPYGFDSGSYDDPTIHTFGPQGQVAWLLKHRRPYRYSYDNGASLNAGVRCGDTSRASADAVTVPLLRKGSDDRGAVFGLISAQSYQPKVFDESFVRAFQWLADLIARVLTRESEDKDALLLLPNSGQPPSAQSDHVVEYLSMRISEIRRLAVEVQAEQQAQDQPLRGQIARLIDMCERTQTGLIELTGNADAGPETRFTALTPTQQRVAEHVAGRLDNEQIAAALGISLHTVKSHLSAILRKYEMTSRSQVADDVRRYLAR